MVSLQPARNFVFNENMIEALAVGSLDNACDYSEVLPQILAQIGPEADIYPSENYYYFSFHRGGALFSGSLRLSSDRRDKGELDYVCYQSYRNWVEPGNEVRVYKRLSSVEGVIVEKLTERSYSVKYGGLKTRFLLHKLDQVSPGTALLSSDVRIGRMQDESGSAFELVFNSTLNDLYFLLDLQAGIEETLLRFSKNTIISRRTGFVYYQNPNNKRYVLVAVNQREARLNSFYDGPFDHLPENDFDAIDFWHYIHKAYPEMIGNHTPGGTVNADGMIFSIMPYRLYDHVDDLGFVETCAKKKYSEVNKIACMIWGL